MNIVLPVAPPPDPLARCDRCRGTEHLIAGDGPTICKPCVSLLGETAADPFVASPKLRAWLQELHADVVRLAEGANGFPEWQWIPSDWPGVRT